MYTDMHEYSLSCLNTLFLVGVHSKRNIYVTCVILNGYDVTFCPFLFFHLSLSFLVDTKALLEDFKDLGNRLEVVEQELKDELAEEKKNEGR